MKRLWCGIFCLNTATFDRLFSKSKTQLIPVSVVLEGRRRQGDNNGRHSSFPSLQRGEEFSVPRFQLRHLNVTGPPIGCRNSPPVFFISRYALFSPKYHFAGRSASSISMRCGLYFSPSDWSSMVRRSCSTNFAKTNFSNSGPKGIQRKRFQAATTSMRHWLRMIGVTVVTLENQYLPARMISERRLGRTKSMVVAIDSASAYKRRSL